MVQITSKELVTTEKQIPPAPAKWEPKKVIKYTGLGAAGLTITGLAYSQLLETAQKVPSAVKTSFEVVTKIPETMGTLNDSYELVKQTSLGLGEGIRLARSAANVILEKPIPVPTTQAGTMALGFQFLISNWIFYKVLGIMQVPLNRRTTTSRILAVAQTAVPGIIGSATETAANAASAIKTVVTLDDPKMNGRILSYAANGYKEITEAAIGVVGRVKNCAREVFNAMIKSPLTTAVSMPISAFISSMAVRSLMRRNYLY